ncbi:hypothetical protein [Roseibium sediminis]|uniref:NrdR family transcriptional regulator n=1 Tax=Roseibium sediminis TaxID=1775174 RepID=UPI003CC8029D
MDCPRCSAATSVKDSRPSANLIRRRRVCGSCGHRFTTYEGAEADRLSTRTARQTREKIGALSKTLSAIQDELRILQNSVKGLGE